MLRFLSPVFVLIILTGCSSGDPVTLGFVGGLSGRSSELGLEARNGMILAVEEWNQKGGINGHDIQLDIRNDKQDINFATEEVRALIDRGVNAIIGPTTSAMAVAVAPLATEAQIPMFGVTVSTNQLSRQDDYFFRLISSTQTSTRAFADYLIEHTGFQQYAVVTDLSNEAYTRSWMRDFQARMNAVNKTQMYASEYTSGDNLALLDISQQLALLEPDLIALATNSVDAALLIKQIRSINPNVIIVTSEWAGSPQLLQLAGTDAEGVYVPRYIDYGNQDPAFIQLRANFEQRFQSPLGYSGLLAYNATQVVLESLAAQTKELSAKDYLLQKRVFDSTAGQFQLDEYGDEISNAFYFITRVVNGQFVTQDE